MLANNAITGAHVGVSSWDLGTIGENIKRLRIKAGFAQQGVFAAALGVPQSRVSDWENDRYGLPDTATLLKIAKGLGCSIDRLLAGVDAKYDDISARDLIRQEFDQDSGLPTPYGGSSNVSAAARIQQLEQRLHHYEKTAGEVHKVADHLFRIAVAFKEDQQAADLPPRRGRRHRKTG